MIEKVKVAFQPEGRIFTVSKGAIVLEAAHKAGLVLRSPCGGHGKCGHCKVQIVEGAPDVTQEDEIHIRKEELEQGYRLACQAVLRSDALIIVPPETHLSEQQILMEGVVTSVEVDPHILKIYVELPEPTVSDQRSDFDRIIDAIDEGRGRITISADFLRKLPQRIRDLNFKGTVVLCGNRIIDFEEADTSDEKYGVALDIGTTTVVGALVDLNTGRQIEMASRTNPQVAFGDDVVSRIEYCSTADGLAELNEKIVSCINDIIQELARKVSVERIYEIVAVGNSTMNHIFLKVSPAYIAQAPYVNAFRRPVSLVGSEAGIRMHRDGCVTALPNIAGFVGADTVAVILASALHKSERIRMAIDIGTNGEIVLGNREKLICCSAAAGPAFEGVKIKFGMRAMPGAIERVSIDDDLRLSIIGNKKGSGICGSGLIDAVAELLRLGIVSETGLMRAAGEAGGLPEKVRKRIIRNEGGNSFVLLHGSDSQNGRRVYLTQKDIREVQLAKGAIYTGVQILLKEYGITIDDVHELYIAGAFGNYIKKEMALRMGLFPKMPVEKITFIGNAALSGAKMALVSGKMRAEAAEISRRNRYVELAGRPDFQTIFADAMIFPPE